MSIGDMGSTDLCGPYKHDAVELTSQLFWRVVPPYSHWHVLGECSAIVISLSTVEAENERMFSICQDVIEECRAKPKNDLVPARRHTRLANTPIESEASNKDWC
jgi:hypothetical protein